MGSCCGVGRDPFRTAESQKAHCCLTSSVRHDVSTLYTSCGMFASLIMFCFSRYGNELAAVSTRHLVAGSGCSKAFWERGAMGKSQGFHVLYRQLAPCVIHLSIIVSAAVGFIRSARIKPARPQPRQFIFCAACLCQIFHDS